MSKGKGGHQGRWRSTTLKQNNNLLQASGYVQMPEPHAKAPRLEIADNLVQTLRGAGIWH